MSAFKTLILSVLLSAGLVLPATAQETSPEKSIVRVNATLQSFNFLRPWEK